MSGVINQSVSFIIISYIRIEQRENQRTSFKSFINPIISESRNYWNNAVLDEDIEFWESKEWVYNVDIVPRRVILWPNLNIIAW